MANGECRPCRKTRRAQPDYRDKQARISAVCGAAGQAVRRALKRGYLVRPSTCEGCGKTAVPIEAAHADYANPLAVRWLCRSCHATWDKAKPKSKVDPSSLPAFHRLGNAKVTAEIAQEIRAEYTPGVVTQRELGARYGLSQGHVSHILLGQHWPHNGGC